MESDSGIKQQCLRIDGGMTENKHFLKMQADILGIPVECRAESAEATAIGAGMAAAMALGIWNVEKLPGEVMNYDPNLGDKEREKKLARWKDAVKRSRNWV